MYYDTNTRLTHPDILSAEVFGCDFPESGRKVGKCVYCETDLFDDGDIVESMDGLFCDMDCCREHYEIRNYQ